MVKFLTVNSGNEKAGELEDAKNQEEEEEEEAAIPRDIQPGVGGSVVPGCLALSFSVVSALHLFDIDRVLRTSRA